MSLIPDEPVLVTYSFDLHRRMRLYLTELRSIGGLSGSPVFVCHRAPIGTSTVMLSLLGTMIGHWDDPNRNHMGFGKVVPVRLLQELLNQKEPMEERQELESRTLAGEATAHRDSASDDAVEFDEFDALTRKLVQVPKTEPDAKREDES